MPKGDSNGFDMETANLEELETFRERLDAKISILRAERRETVIAQVRELMASIGETPEALFRSPRRPGGGKKRASAGLMAKYRDPETGQSWTGRGKQPVWLRDKLAAGAKLEDFAV